jgi:hypothetical protein
MTNFEQVSNEFLDKMSELAPEVKKHVWKGNKAAGKRARKLSLELEKLMKQWRALSTGREAVE